MNYEKANKLHEEKLEKLKGASRTDSSKDNVSKLNAEFSREKTLKQLFSNLKEPKQDQEVLIKLPEKDEEGNPISQQDHFNYIKEVYKLAKENGLNPANISFDPTGTTLSGKDAEAVRGIQENIKYENDNLRRPKQLFAEKKPVFDSGEQNLQMDQFFPQKPDINSEGLNYASVEDTFEIHKENTESAEKNFKPKLDTEAQKQAYKKAVEAFGSEGKVNTILAAMKVFKEDQPNDKNNKDALLVIQDTQYCKPGNEEQVYKLKQYEQKEALKQLAKANGVDPKNMLLDLTVGGVGTQSPIDRIIGVANDVVQRTQDELKKIADTARNAIKNLFSSNKEKEFTPLVDKKEEFEPLADKKDPERKLAMVANLSQNRIIVHGKEVGSDNKLPNQVCIKIDQEPVPQKNGESPVQPQNGAVAGQPNANTNAGEAKEKVEKNDPQIERLKKLFEDRDPKPQIEKGEDGAITIRVKDEKEAAEVIKILKANGIQPEVDEKLKENDEVKKALGTGKELRR